MTYWKYRGKEVLEIPDGAVAFVYLISFSDGTKYIGKKNFYSTRRIKVAGKVNRKVIVTGSDWMRYNSSSTLVKKKIEDGEPFVKEILHFCRFVGAAMWLEIVEMVKRDVLCDKSYLNANIFLKIFRCYEPLEVDI